MLTEYINPRYREIAESIDINTRYPLDDLPHVIDPNTYDKRAFYLGKSKIKREGYPIIVTPLMEEEIERCANDILYFAMKYCYIRTLDHGRILIPLRDYQKEYLRLSEIDELREMIFLAGRQTAKSTTFVIRVLHSIIFNDDYQIAILAQAGGTAQEIFSRVQLAYEELPLWLQIGVVEFNKRSLTLENGSKCFAGSTSKNGTRGFSLNECVTGDTMVKVRIDGVEKEMTIKELKELEERNRDEDT